MKNNRYLHINERVLIGLIVLIGFVSFPIFVTGQGGQTMIYEEQVNMGKQTLLTDEYDQAIEVFNEGLENSNQFNNNDWKANFLFYLGLTRQQQSEKAANEIEENKLLEMAIEHYLDMMKIHSESSSAMYNLAQIYSHQGNTEWAIELFENAISLKDKNEIFYLLNLAELYSKNGNNSRAIETYKRIIEKQPENNLAHDNLMKLYKSTESTEMLPYLWKLVNTGLVLRAQESSIQALSSPYWDKNEKEELLSVFAVSLSKQFYDPILFMESGSGQILEKLSQDSLIKEGVLAIRKIHLNPNINSGNLRWWAGRTNLRKEHSRGVWPADAFKLLIRSFGNWYQQAMDFEKAEAYYLLAATLNKRNPDPEAFLELADLYMLQEDGVTKVDHMVEEYATMLFSGKAIAYRNSQLLTIYKFHKTLGYIYAETEQWGSSGRPKSAIFQLEHAQNTAEKINRITDKNEDKIYLEPRLINLLANAYESTNQSNKAYRLRLDAAEDYIKMEDKENARKVLEPQENREAPAGINESEKVRFENLKNQVKQN